MPDDAAVIGRDGLQPRAQARHGLRGERDLGHEKSHAAAGLERVVDGAQIDLGLARTGNAEKQLHAEAPARERATDRVHRGLLFLVEPVRLRGDVLARRMVVRVGDALHPARVLAHVAARHEPVDRRRRDVQPVEHERF